jgi:sugar phosphate isomerase/epimerase
MPLPPVGAQLIVFGRHDDINKNPDGILDTLRNAGYDGVEGGAKDAEMYRRKLDERGLRYAASHTGLRALQDPKPLIEYLKVVGGSDVCNSGLFTWEGRSLQDYKDAIVALNEAGRKLRDEGIHLHYHNHDFEFHKVDGDKRGIDLLLDGLDFDVVDLCVDVAWVMRGGDDPASFLQKHKDRIGYLHLKDHDGEDWAELGRGKVDFHAIMRILPEMTGVRWAVIEQDTSKLNPHESVTISRRYLRDTFGY